MQLPATRRSRRALTAAATRVTGQNAGAYTRRLAMPWQLRALYYSLAIGELNYASNFYARMLQRLRIYPALMDAKGSTTPIESGEPLDLLNRIQDPGGGRTAILGRYGRLMMTTGEGYLFGRGVGTEEGERWSFVWREELRFDDDGFVTHVLSPNVPYETYEITEATYDEIPDGEAVAYRMWTPNPRFSGWPTSPFQAILEEAEELLVLSRSVMATATSRLVRSPLLVIPEEIAPPSVRPEGDEDPLNDPFLRQFVQHLEAAIDDPASAAALSPYLLYAAAEWGDKIKTIWLHQTETDYMERELRTECIRRIARGLDLPPEVVEGMSDANHWAAWWISDDMWRSHGAPIAEQFCDDLAEAYLRPALREAGYTDWAKVVVEYDASAVVVNPDRSKDADQAFDRGAISYNAYRTAKNFKDSDAQSEEEHNEYLAIKKVVLGPDGKPLPDTGSNPGDEPGPPDGEPGDVSESTGLPASAAKFQGAAELALLRCRELAGSRIRSRRKSCPHCLEGVATLPNQLVASGLGRAGLEPLGAPEPRELVAGGAEAFKQLLLAWGYDEGECETISSFIELHAARTLFDARASIPDTFHAVA